MTCFAVAAVLPQGSDVNPMNATPKTLGLALLAALLMTTPVAADDGAPDPEGPPCEFFQWWLTPSPGYEVRLECLPLPVLENLP